MATDSREHAGRTLTRRNESWLCSRSIRADTIGGRVFRRSGYEHEQVRLPSVLFQPLARIVVVEKRDLCPRTAGRLPSGSQKTGRGRRGSDALPPTTAVAFVVPPRQAGDRRLPHLHPALAVYVPVGESCGHEQREDKACGLAPEFPSSASAFLEDRDVEIADRREQVVPCSAHRARVRAQAPLGTKMAASGKTQERPFAYFFGKRGMAHAFSMRDRYSRQAEPDKPLGIGRLVRPVAEWHEESSSVPPKAYKSPT